jgi:hypothetical protein
MAQRGAMLRSTRDDIDSFGVVADGHAALLLSSHGMLRLRSAS